MRKVQGTKKQGCPAEIRVRTIIKFPEYKVNFVELRNEIYVTFRKNLMF